MRRGVLATLIVSTLLAGWGPAQAQQLTVEGRAAEKFGRLVVGWRDPGRAAAPRLSAEVRGAVLVLRFAEPTRFEPRDFVRALPGWVAFARAERDGGGVRLALRAPARVRVGSSDPLTAIDLVPRDSGYRPPTFVSPDQRRRRAARPPPPPPVPEVDLSVSATSRPELTLILFRWQKPVDYAAEARSDGGLSLQFAARADPDLARLRLQSPPGLRAVEAFNTVEGFRIRLVPKTGYRMRHYREDGVVHVGIAPKAAPPAAGSTGNAGPFAQERRGRPDAGGQASADNRTWLRGDWPDPVPASGRIAVTVSRSGEGIELAVAWDKPVPAAVFARNESVWAVFGADARFDIDRGRLPPGFRVEQIEAAPASILHVVAPKPMRPVAQASGGVWRVRVRPGAAPPDGEIALERLVSDTGRVSLTARLPTAAGIVWFRDERVGDRLAAAIAFGPARRMASGRRFLEAEILPTAHGVAIAPRSDRVDIGLAGESVTLSTGSGLAVSARSARAAPGTVAGLGFVDFERWGGLWGKAFLARRYQLELQAALADPESLQATNAYLDLARFYVAHGMGHEARGLLKIAFGNRPLALRDGRFLSLRGVAAIQAGRHAEAEEWLSKTILRGEKSATLWRALAASRRGDWERADQMFRTAEELIPYYVPEWAAAFHAAAAEAALNAGDPDLAGRHARQASATGFKGPSELAALVEAERVRRLGNRKEAYDLLREVAAATDDPVAARAELALLELAAAMGEMSAGEVAERLEALRYRWRGDGLELRIVGALAAQKMALGRFREALMVIRVATQHNPDAPEARDLRVQASRHFRSLFLEDSADRLDPIEALALFYEFKSLTPIGSDGDRMIRKLARRLVRFDLLEQGAELLQHQIDARVRGPGRAQIAADLASIYLLDRKPERALRALRSTRRAGTPPPLARRRRLLEATALDRMGRYAHAIELTEGLTGADAAMIRSNALWNKADWPGAARALNDWLDAGAGDAVATVAMRAAIAARMAGESARLRTLRVTHGKVMAATPMAGSFDLITTDVDTGGAALAEAIRRLSDLPRVDAFAASLEARLRVDTDDDSGGQP